MNLYPIHYRDTTMVIFALSLSDAKIPYDRVSMKSHSTQEFKSLLDKAKDIPLEECQLILSGPNISYKEIQQAQKNLKTFSRHTPTHHEPPIPIPKELENIFEESTPEVPETPPESIKEPPKLDIPISDDLASIFDEINETSKETKPTLKEIVIPDIFG